MNFAAPSYAYALFALPLLALLKIWADRRAKAAVECFASSERLRAQVLGGASAVWSALHYGLLLLALAFIIVAMTRPQLGTENDELPQSGRSVFIAIDTSKSMLADDMSPNRLTRAKLAAQDLLEKLAGDRVGLVAFAGRAFLQAPLTTDHEAVRESIQALDHTTIPRGGSSLAAAIKLVLEITEKSPGQRCGMVLFTDGQETDDGTLAAAKQAAADHLLILPVGMGTAEGSLIPDPEPEHQGDYVRDERGNVVRARLESALLQQVATITGGTYIELASQALTRAAVNSLLTQLDEKTVEKREESRPIERYQWPLGLGLLCIIFSMIMRPSSRKLVKAPALPSDPKAEVHRPAGVAATVVLFFGFLLFPAVARSATAVDELRNAADAYARGKFAESREAYERALKEKNQPPRPDEIHYGLGASAHKLKDYEGAVRSFSHALESPDRDLQERALRGLGSSLYDLGDARLQKEPEFTIKAWTDSRDHFSDALDALMRSNKQDSAEFKEVLENREFVQKRLDELKKKMEKEKEQQQQKDRQQKEEEQGDGKPDEKEGSGQQKEQQQQSGQDQDQKQKHEELQKKGDQLPEGELKAGDGNKPPQEDGRPKEPLDDKRNEKTGFTPQEARNQLRNYADDQKSAQYLQRRERPLGGKDY